MVREGRSVESGRNDRVQQREQEAEKNRTQEVETWASVHWYWLHPADIECGALLPCRSHTPAGVLLLVESNKAVGNPIQYTASSWEAF